MDWNVFYWVLGILALIYIFLLIFTLSFLLSFKGRLKRKTTAFLVLLSEKKEVLLSLVSLYQELGAHYEEADLEWIRKVTLIEKKKIKGSDIVPLNATLSNLEKRLRYIASSNKSLQENENFISLISLLDDLNSNYRRMVATYNSDLVGYEYWRKQPLYRGWFFLFGFRKKERIH